MNVTHKIVQGQIHVQTYSLNKGLKKFGEKGKKASMKELKQLHDRVVWEPLMIAELTALEKERTMDSVYFLTEKRDGKV